jgi:universal stress protein A
MATIERILVPTDFSAGSYAALGYAVLLARLSGAQIEVVHVAEPSETLEGDTKVLVEGGSPQSYRQLLRDHGEVAMKRFLSDVPGAAGLEFRSRIEVGKPADVTLAIAEREGFDLIVMGTRGRTGIERLVVGSVAEKVIRGSSCPVLTVRVPEAAR